MKLILITSLREGEEEVEKKASSSYPQSAEESLKGWKEEDAADYARKIIKVYGEPDEITQTQLHWEDPTEGMEMICIHDEMIDHKFPKSHYDFVYSDITLDVPSELYSVFAHVTGSILLDGLKKKVTARCGSLGANAITLQFVKDVVSKEVSNDPETAKKEYATRIKAYEKPNWYKDELKEFE